MLSLILLSYYSGKRIAGCYEAVKTLLDKENIPFEFIVMDDGSKDDSYALACELEKRCDNVRAYRLSRNYGSHYSIFAGLSSTTPLLSSRLSPIFLTVIRLKHDDQPEASFSPSSVNCGSPPLATESS